MSNIDFLCVAPLTMPGSHQTPLIPVNNQQTAPYRCRHLLMRVISSTKHHLIGYLTRTSHEKVSTHFILFSGGLFIYEDFFKYRMVARFVSEGTCVTMHERELCEMGRVVHFPAPLCMCMRAHVHVRMLVCKCVCVCFASACACALLLLGSFNLIYMCARV